MHSCYGGVSSGHRTHYRKRCPGSQHADSGALLAIYVMQELRWLQSREQAPFAVLQVISSLLKKVRKHAVSTLAQLPLHVD